MKVGECHWGPRVPPLSRALKPRETLAPGRSAHAREGFLVGSRTHRGDGPGEGFVYIRWSQVRAFAEFNLWSIQGYKHVNGISRCEQSKEACCNPVVVGRCSAPRLVGCLMGWDGCFCACLYLVRLIHTRTRVPREAQGARSVCAAPPSVPQGGHQNARLAEHRVQAAAAAPAGRSGPAKQRGGSTT